MNCKEKNLIELRTKPSESLLFSTSYKSINLILYNDNSFPIIFKLKTTQPNILSSQPARGYIQSHSFIECHITAVEIKYHLILVIQYAEFLNEFDDYLIQWKNLKSEKIFVKKLHCIFQEKKSILIKPIIFTFATITFLTTWIYFRYK